MIDETDLRQEKKWFYEHYAYQVINALQKRNLNACYYPGRQNALSALLEEIPLEATVARGDSVTLDQLTIMSELKKRNQYKIIYPIERDQNGHYLFTEEQRLDLARATFHADVFLTSTNAITLDGKLVNIDAMGTRVSAMIFGPTKVIIVAGINKIVKDVSEAIDRIHQVCAPINSKRHTLKHHMETAENLPCVKTGRCYDCRNEWRACNYTVTIEGCFSPNKGRINVVLIGEEMGI